MDLSRKSITADDFDRFLLALDPDRERAGVRYQELQAKLIKIFMLRGFDDPEDLADQTINIAARDIQNLEKPYDVQRYLSAVAQRIYLKYLNESKRHTDLPESTPAPIPQETKAETTYTCLDQCMAKLNPESRDLIVRYYEAERSTKLKNRTAIAQELGISVNAVRIRSHRIRATLEKCLTECLKNQQEER